MLKNYLTVAYRHLVRNKAFTLINLAGLAVGMAACLLILLYVQDELSYDRFHENADHLYRITPPEVTMTSAPVAPALAETYSGIRGYARILPPPGEVLVVKGTDEKVRFYEERFYWVDSTIFSLFSFPMRQGNPATALAEANTLVISEDVAERYFGDEDPVGQMLIFDVGRRVDFTVSGVMANTPHNAHFRPDFLASLLTFERIMTLDDWEHNFLRSYVLLEPGQSAGVLEAELPAFFQTHTGKARTGYALQPITDIHLRSRRQGELEPPGEIGYVYTFVLLALLILVIACINFMNLSTARSAHRAREVSLRKVLGAHRGALVRQFLGESLLLSFLALLLALPLVSLALPFFNRIADKELALAAGDLPVIFLALGGLAGLVGLLAGSYPALFLSRFAPMQILQGHLGAGSPGVRRMLVVTQFAIGLVLAIGALAAHQQLTFLQTKNLGFDKAQTLVVPVRTYGHASTPLPFEAMVDQFSAQPGVLAAAATGDVPGTAPRDAFFLPEGTSDPEEVAENAWSLYDVDVDFIETLGLELVAGRSFKQEATTDLAEAYLINEATQRALVALRGPAWANPIGEKLERYVRVDSDWTMVRRGRIIGVVADFHYQSLHHRIGPMVMQVNRPLRDYLVARVQAANMEETLAALEAIWIGHVPERPFEYYFLDDAYNQQYEAEQRVTTLLDLFTGLGLMVACLGLFGLAAFTAERRNKEIGVRKVLGASVLSIVVLLSKEFARLVLIAFVIAAPVAYLALQGWLNGFAYRSDLAWWLFPLVGLAALLIALLTVSYQSIKAALANPVDSLRYE